MSDSRAVRLRVCRLWDATPEELLARAKERSWAAKQLRADRAAEDHFTARVARNLGARAARAALRYLNSPND